jgi:hypothetical protein
MLDHLKVDAVLRSLSSRLFSRVALIHISQLDVLARSLLDRAGQNLHLLSIPLVGRRHEQSEQVSQSAHGRMHLRTFLALGPVVAAPLSGLERNVRLSNTAAVGSDAPPYIAPTLTLTTVR